MLIGRSDAISKEELFPYGQVSGEEVDQFVTTEATGGPLQLTFPIVLYGKKYSNVYVSTKGIVTFNRELDASLVNHPFPHNVPAIAPFFADILGEDAGVISYRESTKQEILDKANTLVHQTHPSATSFQTHSVFIATWDDVIGQGIPTTYTNTFQLAVANSGDDSFAFFLYPIGALVWAKTLSRIEGQPEVFAQAGFESDAGKIVSLDGSNSDYLRLLPTRSTPDGSTSDGIHSYHIGLPDQGVVVPTRDPEEGTNDEDEANKPDAEQSPPLTREDIDDRHPLDIANIHHAPRPTAQPPARPSEAQHEVYRAPEAQPTPTSSGQDDAGNVVCQSSSQCHQDATCAPKNGGSCCECGPQFYGNGKLCFNKEEAQRMNGQVSGQINGMDFSGALMHNYIVVNEGRVYVAFSPIPNNVGDTLQTVLPVASVVGWLFALPDSGLKNGLSVTGGVFNHTATVRFPNSGQSVHVSQKFSGLDEHKMLHSVLYVTGTAPAIAAGQTTEYEDHHIEYRQVSAGNIQSFSRSSIKTGDQSIPYTVEETIVYTPCPFDQDANLGKSVRLHITRVVSLYQQQEQASRFGIDAKITELGAGQADACAGVDCGPYANCVPRDSQAQCMCRQGYEPRPGSDPSAKPLMCYDVNECAVRNECSPHAECINNEGSFVCRCLSGYVGDGRQCRTAEESEGSCEMVNNCDPNADCVADPQSARQVCRCREGFAGDGTRCTLSSAMNERADCSSQPEICDGNAHCQRDSHGRPVCACFPGYVGNGQQCQLGHAGGAPSQPVAPPGSCYHDPRQCDRNAACVPGADGAFACQCLPGFEGDGPTCRAKPTSRGGFLAFTQGMSIVKLSTDRNSMERGGQLAILPGQTAVGISVDCADNYLYWSDIAGNTINRARYDGTEIEAVLREVPSAEGLAVDHASRNIFWTDSQNDHIAVAKLTDMKAGYKVVISKNLTNPRAIAIHPERGAIYWTDWVRSNPKIETANMDGSERRTLVNRDLGLPNALAVDYTTDDLCWADAGNQKIECVTLDGNNRRMVYFGAQYPFSMTVHDSRLYWTDWGANNIMSVSKNGADVKTHELPLGSSGKVYGIVSVPDVCPRLQNVCSTGNGGCRHICLPMPGGRPKCVCPDNISPEQCGQ